MRKRNSDGEQGVLPDLPDSESEDEEEKKNKVVIKQMAKQLSKELVLSEGKFSRSKLPKLDCTKMVMVNVKTFPQWLN